MKKGNKGDNMRLDKFLTEGLLITRNEAKKLISSKKVMINKKIVNQSNIQIKNEDEVSYYNQANEEVIITYQENIYIMLNKPQGYVCAKKDNLSPTVIDLLNEGYLSSYNKEKINIIGRLDKDTEGMLLLTTDGLFLHNLTSPKKHKPKKYYVECEKKFSKTDEKEIAQGIFITLEDNTKYQCNNASLEIIDDNKAYITVCEGKFHQVKKMCQALDNKVIYLKRVEIAGVKLDETLKLGEYRELTEEELTKLQENSNT